MSSSASSPALSLKPLDSDDIGWEYACMVNPPSTKRLVCLLCKRELTGGITRVKEHIAHLSGNVRPCPKASKEDKAKCMKAIQAKQSKKIDKRKRETEVTREVSINEECEDQLESQKSPRSLGPLDKFVSKVNPSMRQPVINEVLDKERTHHVHQYVARWLYESGIPFNGIDNDAFKQMCEAIGQYGPGYRPPSQYLLREPLLQEEVERTKKALQEQEEEWKVTGCSIMTDGWSDRKRRSIMNLCVNCKLGTSFISSREDSASSHTGEYIFQYVDKHIEDIGPENVVKL